MFETVESTTQYSSLFVHLFKLRIRLIVYYVEPWTGWPTGHALNVEQPSAQAQPGTRNAGTRNQRTPRGSEVKPKQTPGRCFASLACPGKTDNGQRIEKAPNFKSQKTNKSQIGNSNDRNIEGVIQGYRVVGVGIWVSLEGRLNTESLVSKLQGHFEIREYSKKCVNTF